LEYLRSGGATTAINCGYGHGFSVREVIDRMQKVSGVKFKVIESKRRQGDYANIISKAARIKAEFNWQPEFDELDVILKSSFEWEKNV
jgi:UDP-glucose 4-epimerase